MAEVWRRSLEHSLAVRLWPNSDLAGCPSICRLLGESGLPKVKSIKPPPWSVEEMAAGFIYGTATDRSLAYAYFKEEPGAAIRSKLLTRDEARRIAANIAKLPGLLKSQPLWR